MLQSQKMNSSAVATPVACHHPVMFPSHMSATTRALSLASDSWSGSASSTWYLCQAITSVATVINTKQTSMPHIHLASPLRAAALSRIPDSRRPACADLPQVTGDPSHGRQQKSRLALCGTCKASRYRPPVPCCCPKHTCATS